MRTVGVANLVLLALCVSAVLPWPAVAEQDHLMGYKAKDDYKVAVPANPYILENAYGTENCELKKVAFYLTQSEKNAGDDPRSGPAGNFACYKAKCTGSIPAPDVDSQFGVLGIVSKKAQLVCLPVTDPNVQPPCDATTGGFCWFLGAAGESCDAVCGINGRSYDSATASYAGNGGSLGQCEAVLTALGYPGVPGNFDCSTLNGGNPAPIGCSILFGTTRRWCSSPPTTSGSAYFQAERACACQ